MKIPGKKLRSLLNDNESVVNHIQTARNRRAENGAEKRELDIITPDKTQDTVKLSLGRQIQEELITKREARLEEIKQQVQSGDYLKKLDSKKVATSIVDYLDQDITENNFFGALVNGESEE